MNLPAPLETYETLEWSFEGRGRVYDFNLYLVDGAPWIAVEDVQRCLDAGMNAHLAKPIEPQALYLALSQAAAPPQ